MTSFPVSKASGAAQTEQSSPPVKSLVAIGQSVYGLNVKVVGRLILQKKKG